MFLFLNLNAGDYLSITNDTSRIIPYQVKYYSSSDGLTQVSINTLIKDKQGFIWAGTQNGLNRFDGQDFLQFHFNPQDSFGLNGNFIISLFQDSKDRIWIGTMNRGISYYDPMTGAFYRVRSKKEHDNILEQGSISCIKEDISGAIWINVLDYGVIKLMDSGINTFDIEKTYFENIDKSTCIFISKDQNLIIGNGIGELFYADIKSGDKAELSKLKYSSIQGRISSIFSDDNYIWVGTENGLWQLDIKNQKSKIYNLDNLEQERSRKYMVFSISELNDKLWIGTRSGAYLLDNKDRNGWFKRSTLFSENSTNTALISNNTVNAILPDTNNLVWIGTAKNLNLLDFNIPRFKLLKKKIGAQLNNQVVFSIFKENGNIWVGTSGGGLNFFKNGKVYYFTENRKNKYAISDNIIRSITMDNKGYLWLGTTKGISIIDLKRFNPDKPEFITIHSDFGKPNSLSGEFIRNIYSDDNGNIWIATYGQGLNRFTGNIEKRVFTFKHFKQNNESDNTLSSDYVNLITQDKNGIYWIATREGLNKLIFENHDFDHPVFKSYKYINGDSSSISENSVHDISIDDSGIIWIGTRYGLNSFDPGKEVFRSYFKSDGLANDLIFSLIEDDFNQLWIGTGHGLSCFDKNTKTFNNYYLKDGLQDNEFNTLARFKDEDGNIYFGGVGGATIFYPPDLKSDDKSYDLQLTQLISKNKLFNRVSGFERIQLDKELSYINKIELKYSDFPVYIKFSAPNANPLHFPSYYYKLLPLNKEWNYLGVRNEIQLLDLSPGTYHLYLTGGYNGKIWRKAPKIIDIAIKPPWWKSFWAYFGYFLVLISFTYLFFRLTYRRKLALEESKKWQQIEEMKSEFYTNITHEFRTPLTVILGMADQLKDKLSSQNIYTEPLKMIKRNGIKLLDLVNQLLDMAKIEDGKYQLNNTNGDIVWFIGFIVDNFHSYAASKEIELIFYSEVDILIIDFDSKAIERIISNLIANAIKFSYKNSKIIIHLNKINKDNNELLQIKIKDHGIGIEKSELPLIFNRFYIAKNTKSPNSKNTGTGIGLAMVKNMVEMMNGTITVKSIINKGSIFTIILPVNINHNSADIKTIEVISDIASDSNFSIDSDIQSKDKDLVLIVEDNKDIAKYISNCISDDYSVRYAENGKTGLELAKNIIPDIIISDVMMPMMDGYEMCELLKKDMKTSHIPVILLTARVSEKDKLTGLRHGADAYLMKPFNIEELNVRIEQLLLLRKKLQEKYKNPVNWDLIQKQDDQEQLFLQKIIKEIEKKLSKSSFKISDLVKSMAMSETQLYRKLKALTGKSPSIFVRFIRLQKAMHLLKTTNLNISEIAYDTGFSDPAYFSRVFKDRYGIAPSEVRKRF